MDEDALYAAAIAGDADAIAKLEMEADILNEYRRTILHIESFNGNTERVRFILREFAHKNLLAELTIYKQTALHLAADWGRTEVAEILIGAARHLPVTSFQAFLRQPDRNMNTALHSAVMQNHASIVKLLVEADPSDTHIQNDDGETPMYIAVKRGYNDIVEVISTTCTAPSWDGPHDSTVVRIKNLDQAKSPGGTHYQIMDKDALYAAAIAGDDDAIAGLEMQADKLNEDEETILHVESKKGNTERVRFILREFAHKNLLAKLTPFKETALHSALWRGHTEVASILIDAARHLPVTSFQAFLRQPDHDMNTALHIAVMQNHASIVKLLVEADPSDTHIQNDGGETPLYIAVEEGYNDIVEIISTTCTAPSLDGPDGSAVVRVKNLDQGKSPGGPLYKIMDRYAFCVAAIAGDADAIAKLEMQADILNGGEETILHVESQNRYAVRVRFILREFAKKDLLATLTSEEPPALHLAAISGHTEMAEILIDAARHLPPPPPSDNDNTHDNPVTSFQAFLRQADEEYLNTALHLAVMKGHASIVKLLVEADPSDTHIQNEDGETPMYIAVEKGYNDIVEIISTTCTAPSLDGPHGSAVVRVKNLDQAKSPGGTLYKIMDKDALYAAAIAGDADAIAGLEKQADKLYEDEETILHVESREGNTEHVRFILREFAHKNLLAKLNIYKQTALHLAAIRGHTEVAEILIEAARHLPVTSFQAFLRQPDEDMYTALYRAVKKGHASIVKLLVEADPSDTHIQNNKGKTPMYKAVEEGYNDIVEIISTTCTAPSLDEPHGSTALRNNNLDQADDFEYAASYEDVGHAMNTASQPSGIQSMKSLPQPVNMKTMVLENEGDTSAQLPCISQPCEDATEQDEQVLDMRKSTPSINTPDNVLEGIHLDELQKAQPTISKESLSQHFGKSLDEAREIFGVSRTAFKNMCRDVGIKRWQYGKRKMGSNSSSKHKRRINNEEPGGIYSTDMPCVHDPPVISHTSQVLSTMDIKAMHNGLIIRFELPELSGKSELEDNVIKRLHLDRNSFSIKYEDDGGQWVLITCDEDVRYCMKMSRSWKKTPINMWVDTTANQ